MQHQPFGNTGLTIPPIVFGTSALGNLYSEPSYETKLAIVKECMNHVPKPVVFDCAGKYGAGLALEMLGKCLRDLKTTPDDVIISNKLAWIRTPLKTVEPTFESGVWFNLKNDAIQDISYNGIIKCWEQGNELLGGNYVPQLLSVHDPDEYIMAASDDRDKEKRFHDILGAYRALADLKNAGKIRAIGIGAKNWKIVEQVSQKIRLDWVMFANSMTIMKHPTDLLQFMELLHQQNVGIINSAVFHAGFLTGGKYFDYKLIQPDTIENKAIFKWREDFFSICKQFSVPPFEACVAFAMTPPGVVSISLNTSNPNRVKENVGSVTTKMPDEFWKTMKSKGLIANDYPYF